MLRWIADNKEWLFSGVGVAVIVAVVGLLKIVRHRRPRMATLGDKNLQAVIDAPAPSLPTRVVPSASLTPQQIKAAFEDAPFLQQPDIREQFKGLHVRWSATLVDAEKRKDGTVRLILVVGNLLKGPAVLCTVKPEQHPGLGLLRKDHKIDVSGTIALVGENYVELEQVSITYEVRCS